MTSLLTLRRSALQRTAPLFRCQPFRRLAAPLPGAPALRLRRPMPCHVRSMPCPALHPVSSLRLRNACLANPLLRCPVPRLGFALARPTTPLLCFAIRLFASALPRKTVLCRSQSAPCHATADLGSALPLLRFAIRRFAAAVRSAPSPSRRPAPPFLAMKCPRVAYQVHADAVLCLPPPTPCNAGPCRCRPPLSSADAFHALPCRRDSEPCGSLALQAAQSPRAYATSSQVKRPLPELRHWPMPRSRP